MANAKKCDRCGAYYQEVEPNLIDTLVSKIGFLAKPREYTTHTLIESCVDLCPKCSRSLKNWLSMNDSDPEEPGED